MLRRDSIDLFFPDKELAVPDCPWVPVSKDTSHVKQACPWKEAVLGKQVLIKVGQAAGWSIGMQMPRGNVGLKGEEGKSQIG